MRLAGAKNPATPDREQWSGRPNDLPGVIHLVTRFAGRRDLSAHETRLTEAPRKLPFAQGHGREIRPAGILSAIEISAGSITISSNAGAGQGIGG